jgi:GST-like protein
MEFQRFTAPDPAALEAGIAECRAKLLQAQQAGDRRRVVEHSADLGAMLTTARREAEALPLLQAQLGAAEALAAEEVAGWFWNAYATALQYTGSRQQADAVFAKALALCQAGGWLRLQSFVLQHWGRSLVEQDELDQAQARFDEALAIRRQLNDPRQASTERALAALAELRAQAGRPRTPAAPEITLYGAAASGSVAVEAALTLLNIPFRVVEGATWASEAARARVGELNAMRQIPTLLYPGGEMLTESAAILIHLADAHPESGLAPGLGDPARGQFLRWMFFVSSAIYSLHWIKPDVARIGAPAGARDDVVRAVHERIAFCWRTMDAQLEPGQYLLGDRLSVLDLYVGVVSRFGPWRDRFHMEAPRMTPAVRRVDEDPRLKELWERRFPPA